MTAHRTPRGRERVDRPYANRQEIVEFAGVEADVLLSAPVGVDGRLISSTCVAEFPAASPDIAVIRPNNSNMLLSGASPRGRQRTHYFRQRRASARATAKNWRMNC